MFNKMKILISGSSNKYSLVMSYFRSFKKLGFDDIKIFGDEKEYWQDLKSLKNRYTHRLFWKIFALRTNKNFLNKVIEFKPDLVLIFKGWFYHPKTIKKIKEILPNTKLFCFNPDNPFNTWHHGVSNDWIRASIPYYDAYFTPKKFLIEEIKEHGRKAVFYLPCGYDPEIHYPIEVKDSKEREYYGSDVAFIGTYDEEREWWLNQIKDYNLKIWGNDWWKANKELQKKWMGKAAYGEEFAKICNSSKIVLNIIRKQDATSHNMKTFEIPACKGFVLSNYSQEAVEFFPENIAAIYFKNVQELKEKIDFYLNNELKRYEIIENSYNILINGRHKYSDRLEEILLKHITN